MRILFCYFLHVHRLIISSTATSNNARSHWFWVKRGELKHLFYLDKIGRRKLSPLTQLQQRNTPGTWSGERLIEPLCRLRAGAWNYLESVYQFQTRLDKSVSSKLWLSTRIFISQSVCDYRVCGSHGDNPCTRKVQWIQCN